jgi:hypothetical protein
MDFAFGRRASGAALLFAVLLSPAGASDRQADRFERTYGLDYRITLDPARDAADIEIRLSQHRDLVREVRFRLRPEWFDAFRGDGELAVTPQHATWRPPPDGGVLRFRSRVNHRRGSGGYDAYMTSRWAILRGDDLVPPASVRSLKGATSRARLAVSGPPDWSVLTPYPRGEDDWFEVDRPERRFDRPVGWIVAGELGVRRGIIGGTRVAVAGPTGQAIRRMDMLAFLNWNLPELMRVFPDFPRRLLVVSAGHPMWRGGLSGPGSIFVHADRPLISENGTSTLLHELVHLAQGYAADPGGDWIVEGIAEYYSIEIMRRSGTLSARRAEKSFAQVGDWADAAEALVTDRAQGATTARAVTVLRSLDAELREATGGDASLDDIAQALSERGERISLTVLRSEAERLAGRPMRSLDALDQ